MNDTEFLQGLAKLRALYRGINEDYIAILREKFRTVPGPIWEKAIDLCVDGREDKDRPGVPELWRYVGRVRESLGMVEERRACETCNGSGLIVGFYRHRETVERVEAARPCPICRRRQYENWKTKAELVAEPVESGSHPIMEAQLRDIKPAGARFILNTINKAKYPDRIVLGLLEIAGQDSEPSKKTAFGTAVAEAVPPNVAHLSPERRAELDAEAEAEGIPF